MTERDERTALRFSRAVMLVLGLVVLAVTYFSPPAVFTIGYFAATLFAASLGAGCDTLHLQREDNRPRGHRGHGGRIPDGCACCRASSSSRASYCRSGQTP